MNATCNIVVSLIGAGDAILSSWLVGVPATAENDAVLPAIIQELLPLAMMNGTLSIENKHAFFGIRDADPEKDADLYAAEAREKGLLN